jgi:hypothetical protein
MSCYGNPKGDGGKEKGRVGKVKVNWKSGAFIAPNRRVTRKRTAGVEVCEKRCGVGIIIHSGGFVD